MRVTTAAVFVVGLAAAFASGVWAEEQKSKLHPETLKNLETAMHGEAFAYAKYHLFADHARKSGHADVAGAFSRAAETERFQHFAEEADLAGLVGSDAANLRNAIAGESYETETMYPRFAQQARAAGDVAAADRFEEIRRDEMQHRATFQAALNRLQGTGGAGSQR